MNEMGNSKNCKYCTFQPIIKHEAEKNVSSWLILNLDLVQTNLN